MLNLIACIIRIFVFIQSRERTELLEALEVHPVDKLEAHARALVEALEDLLQAQLVLVLLHPEVDAVEH